MESRFQTCLEQLKNNSIKELYFDVGYHGFEDFMSALSTNSSLLNLNLYGNFLGLGASVECVAKALLKNTFLQTLYLSFKNTNQLHTRSSKI